MKMKLIMIAIVLTAAMILVAGCTSSGSNGTASPTAATAAPTSSQNSASTSPGSGGLTSTQSLTDAQKTQAENLAMANATISSALKSGYTLYGVSIGDYTIPTAVVQYMYNSNQELDEYFVIVDLKQNKITDIKLVQKPLPTPRPLATE
jgi:ABC-type Fe3+-hydroxamate transport system substrate-binding protein